MSHRSFDAIRAVSSVASRTPGSVTSRGSTAEDRSAVSNVSSDQSTRAEDQAASSGATQTEGERSGTQNTGTKPGKSKIGRELDEQDKREANKNA